MSDDHRDELRDLAATIVDEGLGGSRRVSPSDAIPGRERLVSDFDLTRRPGQGKSSLSPEEARALLGVGETPPEVREFLAGHHKPKAPAPARRDPRQAMFERQQPVHVPASAESARSILQFGMPADGPERAAEIPGLTPEEIAALNDAADRPGYDSLWVAPHASRDERAGIPEPGAGNDREALCDASEDGRLTWSDLDDAHDPNVDGEPTDETEEQP